MFGRRGIQHIVLDFFLENLSTDPIDCHIVHRGFVEPRLLADDWLNPKAEMTALFLTLFSNAYKVHVEERVLSRESENEGSTCLGSLAVDMPTQIYFPEDLELHVDIPSPEGGLHAVTPFTSFSVGPFHPGKGIQGARVGFDLPPACGSILQSGHAHTRYYGVEGAQIVLSDIEQFDLPSIPDELREAFSAHADLFNKKIRHGYLPVRRYDVVVKDCKPSFHMVRFNNFARPLYVPEELASRVRWWRAETDDFAIQLVEPLRASVAV
ncbi:MAG: hypothetical protein ACP6IT_10595 [Candidatus Thorarchaeota archaeon]